MKKIILSFTIITAVAILFTGCTKQLSAKEVDAITTASIVNNFDDLAKALSADGVWLAATTNNITSDKDLVVDGTFKNRGKVDRKLALCTQDKNHKIIEKFTLTAPKLIVKSPNFRITGGIFKGDVYVEANGFKIDQSGTVEGNIYFAKQEYMDSFIIDKSATFVGEKSVQ